VVSRFSGASELDIVTEEIGLRSPIWPEVDRRIVLLNADKLSSPEQASKNGGGGRTLSNPTALLFTVILLSAYGTRGPPVY